ncbi:hypothetical protein P7K49_037841, partial [Saguinus oedipus]
IRDATKRRGGVVNGVSSVRVSRISTRSSLANSRGRRLPAGQRRTVSPGFS